MFRQKAKTCQNDMLRYASINYFILRGLIDYYLVFTFSVSVILANLLKRRWTEATLTQAIKNMYFFSEIGSKQF